MKAPSSVAALGAPALPRHVWGLVCASFGLIVLCACSRPADRPPLQLIPRPDIDGLEESVRAHIDGARIAWEKGRADADLELPALANLAETYGRAAHVYQLWPTAEAAYRNALALAPDDFELNYVFATFLASRGQPEEALERLARVREKRADFLPVRIAVVEAHLDVGDLDSARSEAEAGIAAAPGEPGFHFLLGQVELAAGAWQAAVDAFEQSLAIASGADAAHRGLATAHAALGNSELAAHHRDLAGSRRPGIRDDILGALGQESRNTIRYELRAQAALRRGNARAAAALLLHARDLAPTQHRINVALSVAFDRLDQPGRAREVLEQYLDHELGAPARAIGLVNLGHAKARLGLEDEAIAHYGEALRLNPNVPKGSLNLGALMCRRSDRQTALELLEHAFLQQPGGNTALHLAVCRLRAEGTASALTTLRAALADKRIREQDEGLLRLGELRIELAQENLTPPALGAALQRADDWFQRTRRIEFLEMGIHALARLGRRDAALANVDAAIQAVVGAGRRDLQLRLEETQRRIVDGLELLAIDPLVD